MQNDRKPVSPVEEYIRRAQEAETKAKACDDPNVRRSYEATAANWRRLAAFVDPRAKRS